MKFASLAFGESVGQSRFVITWPGTRKVVILLFVVLELHSLVHCCEPTEAPFSPCDMFEHTARLTGSKNKQEIKVF